MIRLDKFLADMGKGTRSEVRAYIKAGRVEVNDKIVKSGDYKINEQTDKVVFDKTALSFEVYDYYMLNKPSGVVSAVTDTRDKTVIDLICEERKKGLFPIGRLDKDTVGLLIITNDGPLEHKLLSPKKHVDKTYFARVQGRVTEKEVRMFSEGLELSDFKTLPARLEIINSDDISEIELTIHEGKFHQVKRMFEAVGMEVIYLKRLSMGSIRLDESLSEGQYRRLTAEETACLKM